MSSLLVGKLNLLKAFCQDYKCHSEPFDQKQIEYKRWRIVARWALGQHAGVRSGIDYYKLWLAQTGITKCKFWAGKIDPNIDRKCTRDRSKIFWRSCNWSKLFLWELYGNLILFSTSCLSSYRTVATLSHNWSTMPLEG